MRNFFFLITSLAFSFGALFFVLVERINVIGAKVLYLFLLISAVLAIWKLPSEMGRFFIRQMHKKPGLLSLSSALGLFFVASKTIEKMFTQLYQKHINLIPTHQGLSPNSVVDMIVEGNAPLFIPTIEGKRTSDAIIIVHGIQQSPKKLIPLYTSPLLPKIDQYLPLLLYHRRSLDKILQMDFHEMSRQLLEDISYVCERHGGEIFCVGHSLGANLLCYLSLRGELPTNVKLILYAPAIQTQIGIFSHGLIWAISWFGKYFILPNVFIEESAYGFSEFVATQTMASVIYGSTKKLSKMLKRGGVRNKFVCIFCEKDNKVLSKKIHSLLGQQENLVAIHWLSGLGHSPHLNKKDLPIICEAITVSLIEVADNR